MTDITLRDGKLIVTSSSRTPGGLWVMNGCFSILESDADDDTLGIAVAEALESSRIDVPDPAPRGTPPGMKAVYKTLRVRNFRAYLEGAKSVEVLRDDERPGLRVIPMENAGPRTGFVELLEVEEQVPPEAPSAPLAGAVRRAFERAR
jgi:hypothetical protein